jgi:hypothetical protein
MATPMYRQIAEDLRQRIESGAVARGSRRVAAVLGIEQAGYRDWIAVRVPNATEADFFKLPANGQVAVVINVGDVPTPQYPPKGPR